MDPRQGNRLLLLQCAAWLLCVLPLSNAYVQFEPLLVPKTPDAKKGTQSTTKVTYGAFMKEDFEKIARTTEDHNCILPGCQRMGEVLDIQRNNVTNFDRDTLGPAGQNATKVLLRSIRRTPQVFNICILCCLKHGKDAEA